MICLFLEKCGNGKKFDPFSCDESEIYIIWLFEILFYVEFHMCHDFYILISVLSMILFSNFLTFTLIKVKHFFLIIGLFWKIIATKIS